MQVTAKSTPLQYLYLDKTSCVCTSSADCVWPATSLSNVSSLIEGCCTLSLTLLNPLDVIEIVESQVLDIADIGIDSLAITHSAPAALALLPGMVIVVLHLDLAHSTKMTYL